MTIPPIPTIALIVASTQSVRFADLPLGWLTDRLSARDDLALSVLDLREHPLPFYDRPTPPAKLARAYSDDRERRLGELLDAADGYLVLTNEFNHGYSAALKNTLDHYFAEFRRKAMGFVGYGNVGGSRAIEQLRQVAAELEMVSTRHALHIMGPQMQQIRSDELIAHAVFESLDDRLDTVVTDLVWWADALRRARNGEAGGGAERGPAVSAGRRGM